MDPNVENDDVITMQELLDDEKGKTFKGEK